MKKRITILFIIIACLLFIPQLSKAQNPTYQQKLFYTCKIWGFVKYFHSNVSVCGVNWDSVLLHCLPLVKSAVTDSEFNNALDTMLLAAGPMALTNSPPCDTMGPELKRNLNFTWINNSILRSDVQTILDTIKNNFRPHTECWVQSGYPSYTYGWLTFPYDNPILNINDYTNYADEWHRLLELFAYWNIINYFNPYNYMQDQPWDSTLYQHALNIDTAANDLVFYTAFLRITHNIDDAHVQAGTYDNYCLFPIKGFYSPNFVLKYLFGKSIVVKSGVNGLTCGDEIISVNGITPKQWEDSLGQYLCYGDSAIFHSYVQEAMISESLGSTMTIKYYDSLNSPQTVQATCNYFLPYNSYEPNDTLLNVQWRYWGNCNIGYVNVGKLQDTGSEISTMYTALQNTDAIIFDIRNFPASYAVWDLIDYYLFPSGATPVAKSLELNINYPGTYAWNIIYASPGNPNPYTGKVIVLFNEETFSAAENLSMQLGEIPNSVKIGSQTAGADGDISKFNLNQNISTRFTALGWFYPNGDSTERVGILPDSVVYPTQAGIRARRDEVLEKALQVANCPLSVHNITEPKPGAVVLPNPNNGKFIIESSAISGICSVEIYNMLGQKIYQASVNTTNTQIDLSNKSDGVYLYRVITETGYLISEGKLIIQK
jgi:hypothetical protein